MKQIAVLICWLMPSALLAQYKTEEPFKKFQTWNKVLTQAKLEKKKIFVDAFATWCRPCKQMDIEVYPNDRIISFLDSNFISLKVQMDQTESDPADVKNWYEDASKLLKQFNITSYPSFIFLDQNGKLIQISKGFHSASDFLALLQSINSSQKGFTNEVADYNAGKVPVKRLLQLALEAKEYGQDSLAVQIAHSYKAGYLEKQKMMNVINPDLIPFLSNFSQLIKLSDPLVKYAYGFPVKYDSLMQRKGSATALIEFYINRDLIDPILDRHDKGVPKGNPDWVQIEDDITKRYDSRTARLITINRQIGYYHVKKDWENIVKHEIRKIELYGLDTNGMARTRTNNLVYGVFFLHIDNPAYLNKAAGYMETILSTEPNRDSWIDTYANILYKCGQTAKAILFQEKALEIAKKRGYEATVKEYAEKLRKMKTNQPTWVNPQ